MPHQRRPAPRGIRPFIRSLFDRLKRYSCSLYSWLHWHTLRHGRWVSRGMTFCSPPLRARLACGEARRRITLRLSARVYPISAGPPLEDRARGPRSPQNRTESTLPNQGHFALPTLRPVRGRGGAGGAAGGSSHRVRATGDQVTCRGCSAAPSSRRTLARSACRRAGVDRVRACAK